MNITFAGQKGGTGKTTLSFLVAETLSLVGKSVAVKDDDPQGSLREIVEDLSGRNLTNLEVWEEENANGYDFVIVDTLPRLASHVLKKAIRETDCLILPLMPSMVDIRATVPLVGIINEELHESAKARIVWNRVKQGTRISNELGNLGNMVGIPALSVSLPDRVAYSYSVFQGYQGLTSDELDPVHQIALEILNL